MPEELAEKRSISLYPQDWAAIEQFAKDTGLKRSTAVRLIIRDWLSGEKEKFAAVRESRATYKVE